MLVKVIENGLLIDETFCFGEKNCGGKILLKLKKGQDYVSKFEKIIEYPGEYEFDGDYITVYMGKDNNLNYFISTGEKRIAILQDFTIFDEFEEVPQVDEWIFTDEKIGKKLEEMEFEGEKYFYKIGVDEI